jgi:hypothetical protein
MTLAITAWADLSGRPWQYWRPGPTLILKKKKRRRIDPLYRDEKARSAHSEDGVHNGDGVTPDLHAYKR